ncbi:hypothetical protein RHMOL_Rhmol02G0147600 [Rhododendron molle]|uniref:Uncharacterized protein n=1 Tax=Rhododendron molle TaxID=49168 RepID=A0ACC0PPW1_RHOML|nr:hypothetical protein RHMOL_Rhmol02G0147600 [Rhododendron molle]
MVMTRVRELKRELMEASVVCESNVVSLGDDMGTHIDPISLGDGVITSKQSTNILDPEGLRRKGRPPCKRKKGVVEIAVKKKRETKKKTLSNEKVKKVEKIAVDHEFGTQESVVNGHPNYMGHSMWPNMIPHNMQVNMTQGGTIFPFSPTLCPTGTSLNQVWRGQSILAGNQSWGGQSSFMEDRGRYWGGLQPNLLQTQGHGCEGQPSFIDMMNAANNSGE